MLEKILTVVLTALYVGGGVSRNGLTLRRTGQPVRARSALVLAAVSLSTAAFGVTGLSVFWAPLYRAMGGLRFPGAGIVAGVGWIVFALGIVLGWFMAAWLGDSWRVGIIEDAETDLVRNGPYAVSRNPYFACYFIMFGGMLAVRPSLLLLVVVAAAVAVFHDMVLREEAHLARVHGDAYHKYMASTPRYLPRWPSSGGIPPR